MTSKERMKLVMEGKKADRIPVMCQFSLGYLAQYFTDDLIRYWYTPEGLADAYIDAARAYGFDGILISIPERDPKEMQRIAKVEEGENGGKIVTWKNGNKTCIPYNDFPVELDAKNKRTISLEMEEIDVDKIPLLTPKDLPEYACNIFDYIIEKAGKDLSIHGEVSTCFGSFMYSLGSIADGLMGLLDDPDKAKAAMKKHNQNVLVLAREQCKRGIDAMKLSAPYVGSTFLSKEMYREFVLPFEKEVIDMVHEEFHIPCYIHTCGAIGDRLDLMMETGADGLECLDPPPIGTVDLAEASRIIGAKGFIKGNLDSVNELRGVTTAQVEEIVRKRLEIGRNHPGGYILSTACSIAPDVPPENIAILQKLVEV